MNSRSSRRKPGAAAGSREDLEGAPVEVLGAAPVEGSPEGLAEAQEEGSQELGGRSQT
jgi:hypothetical protein